MVNPNHITPYAEIPEEERELADDLVFNRREDALERFIAHFEGKSEEAAEAADPTAGMEPEEALHWHILRRKKDGVEAQIDASRREDRRRPDAQRRAAPGHEGGRRQVRRRRADPAVRAPERRGDEEGRRPAREVPRQARGLHEGHRRPGHRVRRRARHRQVARQHDPHQQRLHGRRPRQAGPDRHDPRRRAGARGDRDRPVRAARLDLQADAARRPGAARARPAVPGAGRRRRHQPRLRPPDPVPEGPGVRRDLRPRRLLLQGRVRGPRRDGPAGRARQAHASSSTSSATRRASCARRAPSPSSARPTTSPSAPPPAPTSPIPDAAVLGRAGDPGRPRRRLPAPRHPRAVQAALGRARQEGRGVAAARRRGVPAAPGAHVARAGLPAPARAARLLPVQRGRQLARALRPRGPRARARDARVPAPARATTASASPTSTARRRPASATSSPSRP